MKTFMVPCFVVVEAGNEDDAIEKVSALQAVRITPYFFLYQDEAIYPKEVPSDDEYHSMLDYYEGGLK
jgi:hypothetical protein